MAGLYEKLKAYAASEAYPFHMPGHKRNGGRFSFDNPFSFDITEIDGFDNLHHAEDILRDAMDDAARIYGSDHTYYMVNGSSGGILAAISAGVSRGGEMLVARNCHKSVYHAMLLRGIRPVYLWPETMGEWGCSGGIKKDLVEEMLQQHPKAEAVFLTSPTYEGVCSDIRAIAEIVHAHGAALIVDAAHGAHFNFEEGFPKAAIHLGADLVIESLHKTLPSLTQTAILHLKSKIIKRERLEKFLQIYQTSSPSYVFMASIDSCLEFLDSCAGREYMKDYAENTRRLREKISKIPGVHLMSMEDAESAGGADYDMSKLVIKIDGVTGSALYDWFRLDYQLQPEMHTETYVIMMTGPGDTEEGFHRIYEAIVDIHKKRKDLCGYRAARICLPKTQVVLKPQDADERETETILIEQAEGRVSAEFAYIYPPGIPILVPGEYIGGEILDVIRLYQENGLEIQGISDMEGRKISVIKEEKQHG